MANGNRPAGRAKRIGTSGGGNAARRGSGGFSGVGGGFSGGGSSGSSPAGNFGRGLFGSTRGGCLGRVGTLIIIIIVLSVLFRGGCSGLQLGGLNGDLLGGLTGSSEQHSPAAARSRRARRSPPSSPIRSTAAWGDAGKPSAKPVAVSGA